MKFPIIIIKLNDLGYGLVKTALLKCSDFTTSTNIHKQNMAASMLLLLLVASTASLPTRQIPLFLQEDSVQAEMRLISTSETAEAWMTENQIFSLYRENIKFIDVTDAQDVNSIERPKHPKRQFPSIPSQEHVVAPIISLINLNRTQAFLEHFSSFHTRYYKSKSGLEASLWLHSHLESLSDASGYSVTLFDHSWAQKSVIARIEGESDEIVVLSAHLDSVNQWNPWLGRSPGADDDGSGTATVVEALTLLVGSGFVPKRTLEFHFYSGEEGGLRGSQDIVKAYVEDKKDVYGVYHNDMTGYLEPDSEPVVGLVTDYTSDKLTSSLEMIVTTYSGIGFELTECGYACSGI